jgi:hypothetical protein
MRDQRAVVPQPGVLTSSQQARAMSVFSALKYRINDCSRQTSAKISRIDETSLFIPYPVLQSLASVASVPLLTYSVSVRYCPFLTLAPGDRTH